MKAKIAKAAAGDVTSEAEDVNGIKVLVKALSGVDMNGMRDLGDEAKQKLGEAVILYATENDGKVNLMATATEGAIKKGAHAGNLIKEVASLVGGGRWKEPGGYPGCVEKGQRSNYFADWMKKSPKVVDVFQICVIICVSAKKYPNSCILHNLTTGGRLGVILCQM